MTADDGGPALYLIRHGQSDWNERRLVQGQSDQAELTDLGRAQARQAAAVLADRPVVRLLTSDLRRAVQTAEIVGAAVGLRPIGTSLLREQSFGWLEGLSTEQAMIEWERLATDPVDEYGDPVAVVDVRFDGGESMRDVLARIGALLAAPWITDASGDVVLVSHGDTIRIMLAHLLGDEFEELTWREVGNGEVHLVRRSPSGQVEHQVLSAPA